MIAIAIILGLVAYVTVYYATYWLVLLIGYPLMWLFDQ